MANIQRIREVVEFIETKVLPAEDKHFNMGDWHVVRPTDDGYAKCGTTACFAGWTAAYANVMPPKTAGWEDEVSRRAQEWLELDDYQADTLFYTCPELEDEADELAVVKNEINNILREDIFDV